MIKLQRAVSRSGHGAGSSHLTRVAALAVAAAGSAVALVTGSPAGAEPEPGPAAQTVTGRRAAENAAMRQAKASGRTVEVADS
jgi:hypothetical protein